MQAHQIVKTVLDSFRGLPTKLAAISLKSASWYQSHGRTPKTEDPVANGNVSPVTHYMRYVHKYEAVEPGAGQMLSNRVHAELELEFRAAGMTDCQKQLNQGVLKESFDLLEKFNAHDFDEADTPTLAAIEEEAAQLRDKATDVVAHLRAVRRSKMAVAK